MQHPPTRDAIRLSMSMRRGRGLGLHRQCLRLHVGRALVELDDVAEEPAPARVVTTGWCVGERWERNEGGRGGERLREEQARADHLHHRDLGAAGAPLSGPRGVRAARALRASLARLQSGRVALSQAACSSDALLRRARLRTLFLFGLRFFVRRSANQGKSNPRAHQEPSRSSVHDATQEGGKVVQPPTGPACAAYGWTDAGS